MAAKEYIRKKEKPKKRRVAPILVSIAVIIVIVAAIAFYDSQSPTSNTVYCGAFEYIVIPAQTMIAGKIVHVNETLTTAVSYTTSTSVTGLVGHSYSNATNTVNSSGYPAGAETICKYISNTSP